MANEATFSDAVRALVRIAAAVAGSPAAVTRRVMVDAVGIAPPSQVDEVLLQSYLFAGFPRALNATRTWREVSGEGPSERADFPQADAAQLRERGEAACREVYGAKYDALREAVCRLHPALDEWMVTDGYGKVLSRPGLGLAERELCIVAACAASEQIPQLRSHLRGAQNCGVTRDDLAQTLMALTDIVPREALTVAREELNRTRES